MSAQILSDDHVCTIEELAEITFEAVKCDVETPSLNEWLDRARNDYLVMRLAIDIVEMSDTEVEQRVGGDIDLCNSLMELAKCADSAKEWHEAAAETMSAAYTRIQIVLARVSIGQEG